MNIPTEIDWAQLAAYIDGEGCISISVGKAQFRGKTYQHRITLSISNADKRLPEWCHSLFGGSLSHKKYTNGWSDIWSWAIGGTQKMAEILNHCLPYFKLKREQAEIALAFIATYNTREGYQEKSQGRPRSLELLEKRNSYRSQMIAVKSVFSKKAGKNPCGARLLQ